jgi:catechol 2,3-dioxygenase-like lactoylglutathione lyase family enzyme
MMRFDHLRIPVTDLARSRRWYVDTLGLNVEFEVPDRQTVALRDSGDFTIFLQEVPSRVEPLGCALWFQVADVDATHAEWSARASRSRTAPASRTGGTAPSWWIRTAISCDSGTSAR